MRRLLIPAALLAAALLGVFLYVREADPGWAERLRYPLEYRAIIEGHAENYDLDPALLAAVIYRESRFDPEAVSEAGAIGLMQLLPDTAKGIATYTGGTKFRVEDLRDPELNVRYGAFYLRRLLDKYGDVELALAAYHAGQGNVDDWLARGEGILFPETREYVDDVLRLRGIYRNAHGLERDQA